MKKLLTLLTNAFMILSFISALPIVKADDSQQYGLVKELTDGKEYIMVWNTEYIGNWGDKHALGASGETFGNNTLNEENFSGDVYHLDEDSLAIVWTAHKCDGGWRFKNKQTEEYLAYDSSTEDGLTLVHDSDDENTIWTYRKHTSGYCLHPLNDPNYRIRYSVSGERLRVQNANTSNSYVFLYELGAEGCSEHIFSDCLDVSCESCENISRSTSGLAHEYDSQTDGECNVCGFIRYVFEAEDAVPNSAVRTFGAVFQDKSVVDSYKNLFNITSLIASIAPLEDVTHIDITVEANSTKELGSNLSCQLYWNGWWEELADTKSYGDSNFVTFSADIPEEIESVWLLPYSFASETEISFKITVSATYNERAELNYGEPKVSIVSFSDYQLWSNTQRFGTDWIGLRAQLSDIFSAMSKVSPDYVIFGGDYTNALGDALASGHGRREILDVIDDFWQNINGVNGTYIQVEGNHDPADADGMIETGAIEYDDFIVYVLNEDDLDWQMYSEAERLKTEATAKTLEEFFKKRIRAGETRPIFIASHTCLHYDAGRDSGNNQYSYLVFDVINEAAKNLDIIFLFGHNHSTGDHEVGGSVVFKESGDTIYIADESCYDENGAPLQDQLNRGRKETLNFTYMNYGYVGYVSEKLAKVGDFSTLEYETVLTASEINIYDDKITLTRYSSGGRISEFSKVIERLHTDNKPRLLAEDYAILVIVAAGILISAVAVALIIGRKGKK